MNEREIAEQQVQVFGELLKSYGDSPMATSSESAAHKRLRFNEIFALLEPAPGFSVHDVGMGLGGFHDFLAERVGTEAFDYSGTEILNDYVLRCREKFPDRLFYCRNIADRDDNGIEDGEEYDFVIASGVFHQMRLTPIPDWEKYLKSVLRSSFLLARKGLVFNLVSPYVDFYQPGIYYAKMSKILDFVAEELSRFFVVHHNYPLFEFTVAVYTEDFVKTRSREPEFEKYFAR